jgi:hypothetical protein
MFTNNLALMGHGPRVRDDGSETGVTGTERTRIRPAPFRHSELFPSFLRKQSLPWTRSGESMFIGTRRRKNFRKRRNVSGDLQPVQHGPRVFARGDGLLKEPGSGSGVTGTERTRIRPAPFRHSELFPSFLRKQSLPWTRSGESKFIGTRRRNNFRKLPRQPSPPRSNRTPPWPTVTLNLEL